MSRSMALTAIIAVGILLVGAVGPVTAHDWQVTVSQGPMELGVSSTPETPVAGMSAEFSARIADDDIEGDEDRLSWGGVTNRSVEVHIRGPDGIHDHVSAHIPEDDAHFHWSYVFPAEGTYTITLVTQIEGEEYAFEFQRNVTLLPAEATGEEMEHLSEDVHEVNENVQATNDKVESLQSQVNELNQQVETLQGQLEAQEGSHEDDTAKAQAPGFTTIAALVALVALVAFAAGGRY